MLLLLLASRLVEAGFFPRFIFRRFQLLGAEHGYYRWPRPGLLLCLSGASEWLPGVRGGRVLFGFRFLRSLRRPRGCLPGAFCAAPSGCQGFVLQFVQQWYALFFAETSISRRNCVLWFAKRVGASAVRH